MMKRILFWLFLIPAWGQAQEVSVMSFNIRLDVAADGVNAWPLRRDKVAGLMRYHGADFIGCQEVLHHQLQYLDSALAGYSFVGVARDDGKEKGEYSCIFYNETNWEPVRQGTFWLSATPDSVSMGWDAVCNRVCSYGLFRHKGTKRQVWVYNTHFDHVGKTARREAARLIIRKVNENLVRTDAPVIISGDFNSRPEEEAAREMMTAFANSRDHSEEPPYGPADTWNAFRFDKTPSGCIDYIFKSHHPALRVKKFITLTDSYDMKYPSDHFPVLARFILK
jgi:endonuclease/exonuclease/phosphatase family metal-dependent hydrolase